MALQKKMTKTALYNKTPFIRLPISLKLKILVEILRTDKKKMQLEQSSSL